MKKKFFLLMAFLTLPIISKADGVFQNYCINVVGPSNAPSNFDVFGYNATINDTLWGNIASFGSFIHQVCYKNSALTATKSKKLTATAGGAIVITGQLLYGPIGSTSVANFKCPPVQYSVWQPATINATVQLNNITGGVTSCGVSSTSQPSS